MRKKPYTAPEFFNIIKNTLKENNLLPDILEYSSSSSKNEDLLNSYNWDVSGNLAFGGNEGIYLLLFADGYFNHEKKKILLGTFKTLFEDRESFRKMAILEADFIWYSKVFVDENIGDFTWQGFDIQFYKDDKKANIGYTVGSEESAERVIQRHKENYDYAILIDNKIKKETKIEFK